MASTQNFVDVKLMVDKKKNKVLFAEADGNFVDTLFSFLTLPLGTIVRRVGNAQSQLLSVGCFSNLYESVKNLDKECFCTEMCKDMLLNPKSSLGKLCEELKINIDDTETECFKCQNYYDRDTCSQWISIYAGNSTCSKFLHWRVKDTSFQDSIIISGSRKHEVFVTNTAKFIITDDLQVMLPGKVIELLSNLSFQDMNKIEERIVRFDRNQFLKLLKWMFLSTTPLTDLFVLKRKLPCEFTRQILERAMKKRRSLNQAEQVGKMKIKVMLKKSNKEVVFAEADQDFIDFLFSFLTIPLGQMLHVLNGMSGLQSIDGLYKSALGLDSKRFISENHKNMLLRPKVFPCFNCENQLFPVEANDASFVVNGVRKTFSNPKLPRDDHNINRTEKLGDFVRGSAVFMVMDNLVVTPYSPVSALSILTRSKILPIDLEERTGSLGAVEVDFIH